MKSIQISFLLLAFALLGVSLMASGCGSEPGASTSTDGTSASASKVSHTYDITYNGCRTGQHSFDSFADYCQALQQQELNDYCAENSRAQTFRSSGCPGQFTRLP